MSSDFTPISDVSGYFLPEFKAPYQWNFSSNETETLYLLSATFNLPGPAAEVCPDGIGAQAYSVDGTTPLGIGPTFRAKPGDTVLIAGKGHETYQVFKDSVVPFDDRLEAGRALAARGAGWLHR